MFYVGKSRMPPTCPLRALNAPSMRPQCAPYSPFKRYLKSIETRLRRGV